MSQNPLQSKTLPECQIISMTVGFLMCETVKRPVFQQISPAKGKPEAMPLAKIMISGSTCSPLTCWWPHHLPVLATPACTCA